MVHEEAIKQTRSSRDHKSAVQNQQAIRKIVYRNVSFTRLCMDRRKGFQVVADFDQPTQISNKSMKQREDWWKNSKLLQTDSLVCFLSSSHRVIFLCACDTLPRPRRGDDTSSIDAKVSENVPSLFK